MECAAEEGGNEGTKRRNSAGGSTAVMRSGALGEERGGDANWRSGARDERGEGGMAEQSGAHEEKRDRDAEEWG